MNTTVKRMFGRKQIFSSAREINKDNVVAEIIDKAYIKHLENRSDIDYLYRYYKGDQPILYRTKDIREDICNRIVANRANQIVSFKVGYLCGSPIQYIGANENADISDVVNRLNSYMKAEDKETKDKALIEWQMICGTAYRLVLPDDAFENEVDETPFEIYTLDPRNTFIVYSNDVSHRVLCGVYYVTDDTGTINTFSIYTPTEYIEIVNNKVVDVRPHTLGRVPVIEYIANESRLGAFETVLPLLDAINTVSSNRVDGIEQFIQSLIILYNAELPDGEDANTIQQKGLISLKSVGDNKADIKILSEQLNQTETQTLVDDMYQTVLEIVGMPSQGNANTSDSSNNGAVIMKNGWSGAEARAKDSELMFKQSEREFIKQVLRICRDLTDININLSDIDIHFTRRQYEDLLSKSQVLTTMLNCEKIAPRLAFVASGLFVDSEEAYKESMQWIEDNKTSEEVVDENEEPITDRRVTDNSDEPIEEEEE